MQIKLFDEIDNVKEFDLKTHDKEVISKFMSWLCDKYDIVEPEEDEDVLCGYMKYYTKDELLEKYEQIK